ncbi:2OG-Fe(II) oxygenase family protein [Sorangium sp. So ce124]|uniref:2OG-Fe(II) oxygenase family protein n=1 Tax=Sorangium sp. So ce124 TaxID=3133280 RepID=UPI003F5F05A8
MAPARRAARRAVQAFPRGSLTHRRFNIGDMMEFISNGRLKATRHQVVTPRERAGSERLSIVYFGNPNDDAVFETFPSCLSTGAEPRKLNYKVFLEELLGKMTVSTPSA